MHGGTYQYDAGCTLVVSLSDGLKALLTSGIPDLHLDFGAFTIDSLDLEVDADGGDVCHLVFLVDEAQENVGLAHSRIADDNHLHQEVVLVLLLAL